MKEVKIGQEKLKEVKNFKYLGGNINSANKQGEEVKLRGNRLRGKFAAMSIRILRRSDIKIGLKKKLWLMLKLRNF